MGINPDDFKEIQVNLGNRFSRPCFILIYPSVFSSGADALSISRNKLFSLLFKFTDGQLEKKSCLRLLGKYTLLIQFLCHQNDLKEKLHFTTLWCEPCMKLQSNIQDLFSFIWRLMKLIS